MINLSGATSVTRDAQHQAFLKRHKKTHNSDKPLGCLNCTYRCSKEDALRKNEINHAGEKHFNCSKWGYKLHKIRCLENA